MPLIGEMVPVAPMTTFNPLEDACGHCDIYPVLQQAPLEPAQSLHSYLPYQYPAFAYPDLTSYLQFCDFQGLAASMTSEHDEVDMETFQRLSDSYQPDVQGPLIRERCPIQTLIDEFHNADPAYVMKTVGLAASYSQYRPVKGDGQCGWRAVVFGYFESLLSQDVVKVAAEKARLRSLNSALEAVGYELSTVEQFVEETMALFDSIHQAIRAGNRSDQLLLDAFNDEDRSKPILFHFMVCHLFLSYKALDVDKKHQLLTSATMKLNPDQYQPYLEQAVFEYCRSNVDVFGQEIEEVSLQALTDGVIAPAGINVIVMYLDRSEGNEVTSHRLVANAGLEWPAITLLYRPGHYDMIYKATPIQAHRVETGAAETYFSQTNAYGVNESDLQVLSQFDEDHSLMQHFPGGDYTAYSQTANMPYTSFYAPLMAPTTTPEQHGAPSVGLASASPSYSPVYIPSDVSAEPFGAATKPYGVSSRDGEYGSFGGGYGGLSASYHPPMLAPAAQHCPTPPATSPMSSVSPGAVARKQELQIRLSQPCYEMGQRQHEIVPLETNPFKNSPFNRGHFANPDFQPLMWKAEEDYI